MSLKERLQKLASEISLRHKYLHGAKGVMESDYQALKSWKPNSKIAKAARMVGLAGIDLNWFLFCLGKYAAKDLNTIFLNNEIIDKLKEKKQNAKLRHNDSDFKKFFIRLQNAYPGVAARLHLWMLYALTVGVSFGGVKIAQESNDDNTIQFDKSNTKLNYDTYLEALKPFTPLLIADLIAKEGVRLDENGLHKPYLDSRGIWTIGFGSTVLKDGSKVTKNTPHMTNEEAYELARWHIEEKETYPMLYWYYVYDNDLRLKTVKDVLGIGSVFYNAFNNLVENKNNKNNRARFTMLRDLRDNGYGMNIPDSLILQCFDQYPITETFSFGDAWLNHAESSEIANTLIGFCKGGDGLLWRRWLEAGLITGNINPVDILNCPSNGVSDFFFCMGGASRDKKARKLALWEQDADGVWQPKQSSFDDFKEWVKNPMTKDRKGREGSIARREKVKDFLPTEIQEYLMNFDFRMDDNILYAKNKRRKTIAFNDGIKKIKDMQSKDLITLDVNNRDFLS